MAVAMMNIRIMGMIMHERFMNVAMDMRFTAVPRKIMRMLVVGVMRVAVTMHQGLMAVDVGVALGEVQP